MFSYSLHDCETWGGNWYLQSMIIVRVSLSLASWNGGSPHTSMNKITPRLHISETKQSKLENSTGLIIEGDMGAIVALGTLTSPSEAQFSLK